VFDEPLVLDEPPVLDEPLVLDGAPVFDEPPEPADEPPPQAATSSTMPAVTARTPARRDHARHHRQRPPKSSFIVHPCGWLNDPQREQAVASRADEASAATV
jgi:hypothetical protein